MFRTIIRESAMTTQVANDYFSNIGGETFNGDVTFIATLRALLAPRMPENESVSMVYRVSSYGRSTLEGNSNRAVLDAILPERNRYSEGGLLVCNINHPNEEDNAAIFEFLESEFLSKDDGYVRLPDVTTIFQKNFKVLCYANAALKTTVLFVEKLNIRKYHFIQGVTLGLFPWYFDPEKGIEPIEMELLQSFMEKEPDKWIDTIQRMAAQYDFQTARVRKLLRGIEAESDRIELERREAEVEDIRNKITSLNNQIGDALQRMDDYSRIIEGLNARIARAGENSEIMDYFLCNKALHLENVRGSEITFVVKDYITYYNEDQAESCFNNDLSFVYTYCSEGTITEDQMHKLMNAVFLDGKIKIRVCAAYTLNLRGNVTPHSYYTFGSEFSDCMPNPHINRYGCLGNNEREINSILRDSRDYISALEQVIASAKSLNFSDGTVMRYFYSLLCGEDTEVNVRAFELPDGSVVSPREAVAWLEEQEANDQ